MDNDIGWLHLYGQERWHGDAYIAGSRAGIEALRNALNDALENPAGVAMDTNAFVNDGEGYCVSIHVLPEGEMLNLSVPYFDEIARVREGGFWPWHLPVKPKRPRTTTGGQQGE